MPYTANAYSYNLFSEENIKKYVLYYYGMEDANLSQIKFKDTAKQRAVYKVTYLNKSYCLKKVYFSIEELLFVYSSIEWYYRNKINVPKILPTKDGNRFVNYNNMLFILTPWIDGEKCNYDITENVLESSKTLSKMHKSAINFIPIEGSVLREGYSNLYSSTLKHFEQLLNCSNKAFKYKDKFSKLYLQHFDNNLLLAQTSVSIGAGINNNNLRKSLCHLDYVNKNIIFDLENNIWIIDFDNCKMDYCVHDISYFLRRFLKRDKTNWDVNLALECLNSYEKSSSLNLDEYKYILVYLSFPQKYWKISKDYYNNIKRCNKNSFYTLLKSATRQSQSQLQFTYNLGKYIEKKFNTTLY